MEILYSSSKTNTKYLTLGFVLTLLLPLPSAMNFDYSKQIPALYVFGDSLIDCGNNNYLPGNRKVNFLPYGIDFDGKPTGRYTNGKTVVDYLAIHLGLPFVPPYLGLSRHQRNKITTGINYASGDSGILPETHNKTSLTLDTQTKLFKRTVKNNLPKLFNGQAKLERHLSEALFFFNTGVNDIFYNGTFRGTNEFALYLLQEFSMRLQKIYSLGARKFFVNNIPPAGCFPSRAIYARPRGKCDKKINKGIAFYNRRLPRVLLELQSKLPGFVFVHADLYKFLVELRATAKGYGILETWKPCCPNTIYGDLKCRPNTVPCANRNNHLFFDEHPSQIANQIYAKLCFNGTTICSPFLSNIQLQDA